jgi:hypothetical protein
MKKFIAGLVFAAFGMALYGVLKGAPTPEASTSFIYAVPAFLVFLMFVGAIFSLGSTLRTQFKLPTGNLVEQSLVEVILGSVSFYILGYGLLALGLFQSRLGLVGWGFLTLAVILGFAHSSIAQWPAALRRRGWGAGAFAFFLILLILGAKALEGVQFQQHGDAYITYLVAPRALATTGKFDLFLKLPQLFLSTSVEMLFAWGTVLMGLEGGRGLDLSQWFGQWVSGVLSLGGIFLALIAILYRLRDSLRLKNSMLVWIAIAGAQVPAIRWTQNLAKNDTSISFWGTAGFYLMVFLAPTVGAFGFFGGMVSGALFVGKMATAPFVGVLFAYLFFKNKKSFAYAVLGGVVGSLPVLARNAILTHNPVFPWLPALFPSPLLNEFFRLGAAAAVSKVFNFSDLGFYLLELVKENYLIGAFPVLWIFAFKKDRSSAVLLLLPVISFLAFTVAFRPSTEIRYQGPSLVLVSLFSTALVSGLFQNRQRFSMILNGALALFILATSSLTVFTYLQVLRKDKFAVFSERLPNLNYVGGPAKAWIRKNIPTTSTIISLGDVHIYYLIDYPLTEVSQDQNYGSKIYRLKTDEAANFLRAAPYDYLYLAREDYFKGDLFNDVAFSVGEIMDYTKIWDQHCKLFDHNSKSQVWDLKCSKASNL